MEIGVDVVEIPRIRKSVRNRRFLERVFTPGEVRYCSARRHAAQHYAVRFAAKEAVWKAVGERGLTHRDIQVVNHADGKPTIRLPGRWKRLEKRIRISLSHGQEIAVAMVCFEDDSKRKRA